MLVASFGTFLHCHWYVFLDGSQGVVHFLTLDQAKFPPDFSKMLVGNPALRVSLGCEQAFLCQMIAVWFVFLSLWIHKCSKPPEGDPYLCCWARPDATSRWALASTPWGRILRSWWEARGNPFAWGLNHRRKCPRSWGYSNRGPFWSRFRENQFEWIWIDLCPKLGNFHWGRGGFGNEMQLESKDMTNPFDVSPAGAPDRFTGLEERGMVLPEIFTCYSMLFKTYLHYLPGSRIYHIYTPIYTISTPPSCWVSLHAFNPVHIDDLKVLLFDSVEGCRFSSANNLIYIFIHTYMYTYNYINYIYIYISYIYIRQVEWWRRGFKCGPSQVEQYQSPPVHWLREGVHRGWSSMILQDLDV